MAAVSAWGVDFRPSMLEGASCAFGVFDGVHEGHQYLIAKAVEGALAAGAPALAITFDRDPDELFAAGRLKKLMTNQVRLETLAATGVDAVLSIPFTADFAANSPDEFLELLFGRHTPGQLHVGADFRFGAKAQGTVEQLLQWGGPRGMEVAAHELLAEGAVPVTATRIRRLLEEGRVQEANALLTRPYSLQGTVVEGRGEGREFGFRTANLQVPVQMLAIGPGVYGAWATVEGRPYRAAVAVGVPPTFAEEAAANVEVHLIGFEGDIYGQPISVQFAEWLRPMRKFSSVEELKATVLGNIAYVRDEIPPFSF
ncbi:riboflavin biosynthesis protein RibF [Parvibacter caecicola]|nr:riboflavin biosynthesis protein RibF [Parvibacter caecicola]